MKKTFQKIFAIVLLFSLPIYAETPLPSTLTPVIITKHVDGDTFWGNTPDGENLKFRLIGIDTPETVHPRKPVEPFGPEASALTKTTCPLNTLVWVQTDQKVQDPYKRILVYVFRADGKMLNAELVRLGLAEAKEYPPNVRYTVLFEKTEKFARQQKLGIWQK